MQFMMQRKPVRILTGRQLTVFISSDCITSYPELSDLNSTYIWSHGFMGENLGIA